MHIGGFVQPAVDWRRRADAALCLQGKNQDHPQWKQTVDGSIQKLLLAVATAPALVDLRVHLPDHLSMSSMSLVSAPTHWTVSTYATKHSIEHDDGCSGMMLVSDPQSASLTTSAPLLQLHAKLLGGLTSLHVHGVHPPVTTVELNSLFSALPALEVLPPPCKSVVRCASHGVCVSS